VDPVFCALVSGRELLGKQDDRERRERQPRDAFSGFPEAFAEAMAEAQTELGDDERLDRDHCDRGRDGDPQQAEREADRELVQADAQSAAPTARPSGAPSASPTGGIAASNAVNKSETGRRVARLGPSIPSAAATANVSRPSGTISAISFAATAAA
jgi:hypothetical protein